MPVASITWMLLILIIFVAVPLVSSSHDQSNVEDLGRTNRRTQLAQTARFTVGISLSLDSSCSDLASCPGAKIDQRAAQCFYCPGAMRGLLYWRAFINTRAFLDKDGHKLIVDIDIKSDYGNYSQMVQNYQDLCNSPGKFGGPMVALIGPSWFEWNKQAAIIANQCNLSIFLWATDFDSFAAEPGPSSAANLMQTVNTGTGAAGNLTSAVNASSNVSTNTSRRLLDSMMSYFSSFQEGAGHGTSMPRSDSRVCDGSASSNCDTHGAPPWPGPDNDDIYGTKRRDIEDASVAAAFARNSDREWKPGVIFRRTQGVQTGYSSPMSSTPPCSAHKYMSNPFYPWCSSSSVVNQHARTMLTTPTTHAVMSFPAGTSGLKLVLVPYLVTAPSTQTALRYRVKDLQTGSCVAGIQIQPQGTPQTDVPMFCTSPSVSCYGNNTACTFNYRGMQCFWSYVSPRYFDIMFSCTGATTVDLHVEVETNTPTIEIDLTFEYTSIQPCPTSMPGCVACETYPSCAISQPYPVCDGSHAVSCSNEPNPDGEVWDAGLDNVFDVTYRVTTWTLNAIDQIHRSGARFMFFLYWEEDFVLNVAPRRRCSSLANYAANLNGTSVTLYSIKSFMSLQNDLMYVQAAAPDAMIHCGNPFLAASFALAASRAPQGGTIMAIDRPMGYAFIASVKGFVANYMIEPMKYTYNDTKDCVIFGTYADFVQSYKNQMSSWNLGAHEPHYAVLAINAIGALLVSTMQHVGALTINANNSVSIIKKHLHSSTTHTFFGNLNFTSEGQRWGRGASTRQYVPVVTTKNPLVVYDLSDISVVENIRPLPSGYSEMLRYWGTGTQRRLDVYPCNPGCYYSLLTRACSPCAKGMHRNSHDTDCRQCPPGRYADTVGIGICAKCPEGASCTSSTVLPQEHFYALTIRGITGNNTGLKAPLCVDPGRVLNRSIFEPCLPIFLCRGGTSNCIGSNRGLLCGQCPEGETVNGWLAGMRTCRKCQSRSVILPLILVFIGIHVLLIKAISISAQWSVADGGCIVSPLLRSMLHHLQGLAIIWDGMRLNTITIGGVLGIPGDVLVRPLHTLQLECVRKSFSVTQQLVGYRRAVIAYTPLCCIFLLVLHFLRGIIAGIKAAFWALCGYLHGFLGGARNDNPHEIMPEGEMASDAGATTGDTAERIRQSQGTDSEAAIGKGALDADLGKPQTLFELADPPDVKRSRFATSKRDKKPVRERAKASSKLVKDANAEDKTIYVDSVSNWLVGDTVKIADYTDKREVIGIKNIDEIRPSEIAITLQWPLQFAHSAGAKVQKKEAFSKLYGPGAVFLQMHEGFAVRSQLRSYFRDCFVALIVAYPIVLMEGRDAITCLSLQEHEQLRASYDIKCNGPIHKEISSGNSAKVHHYIIWWGFPAIYFFLWFFSCTKFFDLDLRVYMQAFFAGYKPDKTFWEVLVFFRTGVLAQATMLKDVSATGSEVIFTLCISICAQIAMEPYEDTGRRILNTYNILSKAALIWTAVVGLLCEFQIESVTAPRNELAHSTKEKLLVINMLVHLCILLYGILGLAFNAFAGTLHAMVCDNPLGVSSSARNLHFVATRFFRGMSPVLYFSRKNKYFIDVSRLDEGERRFLLLALTETVRACVDSATLPKKRSGMAKMIGGFPTWLIENAIHETFGRAMQNRMALLRAQYQIHGTRPYYLLDLYFVKFFQIRCRPPDIACGDIVQWQDATKVAADETTDGVAEKEEWSSGVTVDELHRALRSVITDLLQHEPGLYQQPCGEVTVEAVGESLQGEGKHDALVWTKDAALHVFEDFAKTWGSIEISDKGVREEPASTPGPHCKVAEQMMKEAKEFRRDNALAVALRERERHHAMLQEEISSLERVLAEKEGGLSRESTHGSAIPFLGREPTQGSTDSMLGLEDMFPSPQAADHQSFLATRSGPSGVQGPGAAHDAMRGADNYQNIKHLTLPASADRARARPGSSPLPQHLFGNDSLAAVARESRLSGRGSSL